MSSANTHPSLPKYTWLLTLFLCFHLSVLLITPNKVNYFGYRLFSVIEPYVQFFEFSAEWMFFSPDPLAPMDIEWSVFDSSGNELKKGTFPELQSPSIFGDRHVRRVAVARFMILRDGNVQKTLAPYLCQAIRGAFSVRLTRVMMYPPALIEVVDGKKDARDTSAYERTDLGMEYCGK